MGDAEGVAGKGFIINIMTRNLQWTNFRLGLKVAAIACCLACLSACGRDEEESAATATPASNVAAMAGDDESTNTVTTGPQSMESENQVEFFTERYLRTEERLKRRQDRIKSALSD